MAEKKAKHKLSVIPTAYEEAEKTIANKNLDNLHKNINALEAQRRKKDEKAILEILNDTQKKFY